MIKNKKELAKLYNKLRPTGQFFCKSIMDAMGTRVHKIVETKQNIYFVTSDDWGREHNTFYIRMLNRATGWITTDRSPNGSYYKTEKEATEVMENKALHNAKYSTKKTTRRHNQ